MSKTTKISFCEKESKLSIHTYEELAALHAIAKILAQPLDLREQMEQVLQEMSARLDMQRGMISLVDREKKEVWLDVAHDVNIDGLDVTYKPGEGITGKVAETGRPMAAANLGQETHFLDRTGARRHLNARNFLSFVFPLYTIPMLWGSCPPIRLRIKLKILIKKLPCCHLWPN